MSNRNYHELIVWKEAHTFVLAVYGKTATFPKQEQYGVTSQLRRAAVSVPANIVEGNAKSSAKDQLRFCEVALGSLNECAYLLELSRDLHYLSPDDYHNLENQRGRTEYLLLRLMNSKGRNFASLSIFPPS